MSGSRIPKRAEQGALEIRAMHLYPNARSALTDFLRATIAEDGLVLLPSYIGVSAKEGSGVFDPIRAVGCRYAFYRLDGDLHVDLEDLATKVSSLRPRVVLLIHYFGWPDPQYDRVVELARSGGALVVEDSAHAMLSDVIGGIVGRQGDASIWSLHKMLPVSSGGVLLLRTSARGLVSLPEEPVSVGSANVLEFDLAAMAAGRREKAVWLLDVVQRFEAEVVPLRPTLPDGVVPQTFPVIVQAASRDGLYESLNAAGFGVVSLYHTLIPEIEIGAFRDCHAVSRSILNLPVHESASKEDLARLLETLVGHAEAQRAGRAP